MTKRTLNIPCTCSHPCHSAPPGTISQSAAAQRAAGGREKKKKKQGMTETTADSKSQGTSSGEEVQGNKMFLTVANLIRGYKKKVHKRFITQEVVKKKNLTHTHCVQQPASSVHIRGTLPLNWPVVQAFISSLKVSLIRKQGKQKSEKLILVKPPN